MRENMKKNFQQSCCVAATAILMFCMCFSFVGCGKEKKYDVSIKIANNYGSTWIFTPDIDVLRYEFEYTGEEMRFWVDSYNLPKHPRWSKEWFAPNTSGANVFQASYGKVGQMYYEEGPKFICERGEYYYCVYADTTSDLWNSRTVYLYITVI